MISYPTSSPCNIILPFFTSKGKDYVSPTSWLLYAALPCDLFVSAKCNWGEALWLKANRQQTASQHLFCSLEDIFHVMNQFIMRCHMKVKISRRKHRHPGNSSQCSLVMSIEPVLDVSLWWPHYLSSHVNALILKYYLYYFILNYFALIYSFVRWGHVLIWFLKLHCKWIVLSFQ